MNDLTKIGTVPDEEIDKTNLFASLLRAGIVRGRITDAELLRIRTELAAEVKHRAKLLVKDKSTSVRSETAQKLLSSVMYAASAYLGTSESAEDALNMLKTENAAVLAEKGGAVLSRKTARAKGVYVNLKKNLFETQNEVYNATVKHGIASFFRLYDAYFFADETHITADYPVFTELKPSGGIEFISDYLDALSCENAFCLLFSPSDVESLLMSSDENFASSVVNIYGRVLISSLFCVLTDTSPATLFCRKEHVYELCFGKTSDDIASMLLCAAERLAKELRFTPKLRGYVFASIDTASKTVFNAMKLGTLSYLFPEKRDEKHKQNTVTVKNDKSLSAREYTELTEKIFAADTDEEKASLILSTVHSPEELADILRDSALSEKATVMLLRCVPPEITAVLLRFFSEEYLSDERDATVCASLKKFISGLPRAEAEYILRLSYENR